MEKWKNEKKKEKMEKNWRKIKKNEKMEKNEEKFTNKMK